MFIKEATGCPEEQREKLKAANLAYFEAALAEDSYVSWLALDGDRIAATSGLSFMLVPPTNNNVSGKIANIMNMFTFPEYQNRV